MNKLTPKQAKTYKQIEQLSRSVWYWKDYWFLIDKGVVHIAKQKDGKEATALISISRKVFESMIKVYETGKK